MCPAPVVTASRKGQGKTRLCTDYRKVKNVTNTEYERIPRIDDIIDANREAKMVLCAACGHLHVLIKSESTPRTALVAPNEHFE